MSSQRMILAIAMFAALVAVAQCRNQVLGERQHDDFVVESKRIETIAEQEQTSVINYTCAPPDGKKITAVELVDQYGNKSAAFGKIINGGVGKPYITVNIQSQTHYGIDSVVKCYAH